MEAEASSLGCTTPTTVRVSLAGVHQIGHVRLVVGLVHPGVVVVVAQIAVGRVDQFELDADEIAVPIGLEVGGDIDVLVLGELLDHLVQLGAVPQAEGVQRIVGDGAVRQFPDAGGEAVDKIPVVADEQSYWEL